jgi:hypothetical protein
MQARLVEASLRNQRAQARVDRRLPGVCIHALSGLPQLLPHAGQQLGQRLVVLVEKRGQLFTQAARQRRAAAR